MPHRLYADLLLRAKVREDVFNQQRANHLPEYFEDLANV